MLQTLKRRATNEKASEIREHPDDIRHALMGCFLHERAREVTDDVTRMAIELIQRLGVRSEKQIHREWLRTSNVSRARYRSCPTSPRPWWNTPTVLSAR